MIEEGFAVPFVKSLDAKEISDQSRSTYNYDNLNLSKYQISNISSRLSTSLVTALLLGEYHQQQIKAENQPQKPPSNKITDFVKYAGSSKAFYSGLGSCLVVAAASKTVASFFLTLTFVGCYIGFRKEKNAVGQQTERASNNKLSKFIKDTVLSPALVQFVAATQYFTSSVITFSQNNYLFSLSNFLGGVGLVLLGKYINNSVAHNINKDLPTKENKITNIKWTKNPVIYFATSSLILTFNNLLFSDLISGGLSSVNGSKLCLFSALSLGTAAALYNGIIKRSANIKDTTTNFKNSYIAHFLLNTTHGVANILSGHIYEGLGCLSFAYNNLQVVREQNRELIKAK